MSRQAGGVEPEDTASATHTGSEPSGETEASQDAARDSAEADSGKRGGRGLGQLSAQEFDALESVGGIRGLIETVLPGLVFVVLFVITGDLTSTVIASVGVAVVATIVRLATRSPVTQAISGLAGVGIGAVWAWQSGDAEDYYAWGLLVNLAWSVGVLVSILIRWPVVGVMVSLLFGRGFSWRQDRLIRRRYTRASWLWAGAFVLRLAVQTPLYFDAQVGWLGTARLLMGLPMWALVLWLTWVVVRPREDPEARSEAEPPVT